MDIVNARGREVMTEAEFIRTVSLYETVLIDIGCGDGVFPYRLAAAHNELFCIGIDPNWELMAGFARRAERKPSRGGINNILYVASAAQSLPKELKCLADVITVNYPWSGLLRAIIEDDSVISSSFEHLASNDCLVQILLNVEPGVPEWSSLTPETMQVRVMPALTKIGFTLVECDWLPLGMRPRSRWGGRLVRGSQRDSIILLAERGHVKTTTRSLLSSSLS